MRRPFGCDCLCDPPDCLGCSPTWINNPALPLKAHISWTPPTWGMPSFKEHTISGISLYTPLCASGFNHWNCGTWVPAPAYCGCGSPALTGTLVSRWYDGPTGDISGSQVLGLNASRCSWSAGKFKYMNQYEHSGWIALTSPDGLMGGGPMAWGQAEWNEEVIDAVDTSATDIPFWTDPGTDSFTALQTTIVARLWSLNGARPHDNDYLGWSQSRYSFGWGMSVASGRYSDGTFRWNILMTISGTRTWKFTSTLAGTGPYAGTPPGTRYGVSSPYREGSAVASVRGITRNWHGADWINDAIPFHPTYELLNRMIGTPSDDIPGYAMSISGNPLLDYNPLPTSCMFSFTSDNPVNCDVDFQDEVAIPMSITPGQEAKLAAYATTFGLSIPSSFSFVFEPNI
jgi:hypothetical protein